MSARSMIGSSRESSQKPQEQFCTKGFDYPMTQTLNSFGGHHTGANGPNVSWYVRGGDHNNHTKYNFWLGFSFQISSILCCSANISPSSTISDIKIETDLYNSPIAYFGGLRLATNYSIFDAWRYKRVTTNYNRPWKCQKMTVITFVHISQAKYHQRRRSLIRVTRNPPPSHTPPKQRSRELESWMWGLRSETPRVLFNWNRWKGGLRDWTQSSYPEF